MEGNVCRDLSSSIQQEELIYLQQVAELLLFLLMPKVRVCLDRRYKRKPRIITIIGRAKLVTKGRGIG